jgi:nitric oxide reductase large subunit
MRKLEGIVKEVQDELGYLKSREERFSQTNGRSISLASVFYDTHCIVKESTLTRIQHFSWFIIVSFVGLGVWQILHLRSFFKRKYLID